MQIKKGIPTKGPKDITYRSRIEAQWAHIFDALGWKWEYEPIDLEGYIPDFVVKGLKDILIEVKGDLKCWDKEIVQPYVDKILKSGWEKPFMIVGASYDTGLKDGWIKIGYGGHRVNKYEGKSRTKEMEWKFFEVVLRLDEEKDAIRNWNLGKNTRNYNLKWISSADWKTSQSTANKIFDDIWNTCKEKVRWKPPILEKKCENCGKGIKKQYEKCFQCYTKTKSYSMSETGGSTDIGFKKSQQEMKEKDKTGEVTGMVSSLFSNLLDTQKSVSVENKDIPQVISKESIASSDIIPPVSVTTSNYKTENKVNISEEKIITVATCTATEIPKNLLDEISKFLIFTDGEKLEVLYLYGGGFKVSFDAKTFVYVGVTSLRLFKIEKGSVSQVQRSRIRKIQHIKNGWFSWDKIQVTLDDNSIDTFGIYHGDACEYMCKTLGMH